MRKTSLSHEDRGSMEAIQDGTYFNAPRRILHSLYLSLYHTLIPGVYQTLRAIHAEPGRLKDLFLTSRQYKVRRRNHCITSCTVTYVLLLCVCLPTGAAHVQQVCTLSGVVGLQAIRCLPGG